MINIKFARLNNKAIIPSKRDGDAGYDIYGVFDKDIKVIQPHETQLMSTGIASAMDTDYYFQIEERGSTGSKGIKKSAGVIEGNYRGEWFIPITNTNDVPLIFFNDEKLCMDNSPLSEMGIIYPQSKAIAQFVVLPVPKTNIEEISIEDLNKIESNRGTGALGSTGK